LLGAAAAAPTALGGNHVPADSINGPWPDEANVALGSVRAQMYGPSAESAAYKAFRALVDPREARRSRQFRAMQLAGGLPAHIASNRSWAPWFKADRSVAYIDQQSEQHQSFLQEAAERFLGRGK
jgi:hypothetical protein